MAIIGGDAVILYGLDSNDVPVPLKLNADGTLSGGDGGYDYLLYQEQQSSGVAGGTFTSGAWRTRLLNTEVSDSGGHGSIASNQVTLSAGTYELDGWAMAHNAAQNKLRWQNITDAATVLEGSSSYAAPGGADGDSPALIKGRFTIAGTKTFELQHQGTSTKTSDGFGVSTGFGTEIYSAVELRKVA